MLKLYCANKQYSNFYVNIFSFFYVLDLLGNENGTDCIIWVTHTHLKNVKNIKRKSYTNVSPKLLCAWWVFWVASLFNQISYKNVLIRRDYKKGYIIAVMIESPNCSKRWLEVFPPWLKGYLGLKTHWFHRPGRCLLSPV